MHHRGSNMATMYGMNILVSALFFSHSLLYVTLGKIKRTAEMMMKIASATDSICSRNRVVCLIDCMRPNTQTLIKLQTAPRTQSEPAAHVWIIFVISWLSVLIAVWFCSVVGLKMLPYKCIAADEKQVHIVLLSVHDWRIWRKRWEST